MKWQLSEPKAADVIRVKVGSIYHYGIYVTDDEVIQFGPRPSERVTVKDCDVEVISSDIEEFLGGGFLEVCLLDRKERKKARAEEETVAYARAKLGTRGYNIIHNNCEHFAFECRLGERISTQTEQLRERFRSLPVVDVYLAKLPQELEKIEIFAKLRAEEIFSVSNERVRREKYYAWRLLEYAAERSLGLRAKKLTFKKEPCGAWSSPSFEFSISHSADMIAVAVSRAAVGVDIECEITPRAENFANRILTEGELSEYLNLPPEEQRCALTQLWTKKEAIFKKGKGESFVPSKIEAKEHSVLTKTISADASVYVLSVATDTPQKVRIIENVELEKT